MTFIHETTTTAPVNIAVIKYWGKRDTKLNLPTNSSLSVTLSQDDLCSRTTIRASETFQKDRLWLNGIEEDITANGRLVTCLAETRAARKLIEEKDSSKGKISTMGLHICSENNFPTAAGLASSASGFACLVACLAKVFELEMTPSELSVIARQGSGSACRSLFGGFVAWEMGSKEDGSDSLAVQIDPLEHWPDLHAIICVVSDAKKGVGSTLGMQNTVKTSPLLKERINGVQSRMEGITKAIHDKDFESFADITMRDSNQFHAVCLDTHPPIFYLNDVSRGIIALVHELNRASGKTIAAYTFDAGPNAVLYLPKENVKAVLEIVQKYFPGAEFQDKRNVGPSSNASLPSGFNEKIIPVFPPASVKQILHTSVGDGPRSLAKGEGLLNAEGFPKRVVS